MAYETNHTDLRAHEQRNIKKQINETIELNLNTPAVDMWDKILVIFKSALEKGEQVYSRKATSEVVSHLCRTSA